MKPPTSDSFHANCSHVIVRQAPKRLRRDPHSPPQFETTRPAPAETVEPCLALAVDEIGCSGLHRSWGYGSCNYLIISGGS